MLPFDTAFAMSIADDRSPAPIAFFSLVTKFGDVAVVIAISILACLFFIRTRHRAYVPTLIFISLGSALSVAALKVYFAIARPESPIALMTLDSFSFPSGHSAAAVTLYGFMLYLAVGVGHMSVFRKFAALVLAILIILIGVSRLYLGVHYPSDIIGGYFVGFLWLAIGMWLTRHLRGDLGETEQKKTTRASR